MPVKRRFKRRYRKKYPKSKVTKSLSSKYTVISRHKFITALDAPTGATPLFGSMQFKLSDLGSYTEFTNLYDDYKIVKIILHFVPRYMTNSIGSVAAYKVPFIMHFVDYNDAATPAGYDDFYQVPKTKIHNMLKTFKVSFTPRVSQYLYTGATSGYVANTSWVESNYPDVLHYGFKYAIENTSTGGANVICSYNVFATFKMLFKGVR